MFLFLWCLGVLRACLSVKDVNTNLAGYCREGDLIGAQRIWNTMTPKDRTGHIPICLNEAMNSGRLEVFEWVLARPEAKDMNLTFLDLLKFGQTKSAGSFICAIQRHFDIKEAFLKNCEANLEFEVFKDIRHPRFDPAYLEEGLKVAWQHGSYQSAIEIISSGFADHISDEVLEQIFFQACYSDVPSLVSALLRFTKVDPTTQYNSALCLSTDYGHVEIVDCLLNHVDPRFSSNYLFHYIVGYATPEIVYLLMSDPRFFLSEMAIISSINDENMGTACLLLAHPHVTIKFLSSLITKATDTYSPLLSLLPLIEAIRCIKTDQKCDISALDDDHFRILLLAASLNGKPDCLSSLLNTRLDNPEWIQKIYRLTEKMGLVKVLLVFNAKSQCIIRMNTDKFSINARVLELCRWRATGSLELLVTHLCNTDSKVRQCMRGLSKQHDVDKNADMLERHIYSYYAGLKGIQALLRNANAVLFARVLLKAFLPLMLVEPILKKVKKSLVTNNT